MHATVVYESMFGNTYAIATAVAAGLADGGVQAEVVPVGDAPLTMRARTGLLVLGAPTHSAGIPRPRTRADAGYWMPTDQLLTPDVGIREWLDAVHGDVRAVRVATFDTRIRRARKPGSAAHAALLELARRGFVLASAPESFWVSGMTGPLLPGEVERARAWGRALSRLPATVTEPAAPSLGGRRLHAVPVVPGPA
jgi:hypothetical protein